LLLEDEAEEVMQRVKEALQWDGPTYKVAAISKTGTHELCKELAAYIQELPVELTPEEERQQVEFQWDDYHKSAMDAVEGAVHIDDDDWDDDEDEMMEVIYVRD
jgi:GTP-binding protein